MLYLLTSLLFFPYAAGAAKSLQSCLTLWDPIDGSPPGSSVHRILKARILEWVAISFSNACMYAKSIQSCPTLCDLMDSSPPGPSIHGILQARILEWVAISFSFFSLWPFAIFLFIFYFCYSPCNNINNLRYADDTTLMAESEEELKSLLMKVKEESEKVG